MIWDAHPVIRAIGVSRTQLAKKMSFDEILRAHGWSECVFSFSFFYFVEIYW